MSRDRGIRGSPKHGVNPSMGACYWCHADYGFVVLMGRLPGDEEAPKRVIVSKSPCPKCVERIVERTAEGVMFVECIRDEGPTGRIIVLKDEAVRRLVANPEMRDDALRSRIALMEPRDFEVAFGDIKSRAKGDEN